MFFTQCEMSSLTYVFVCSGFTGHVWCLSKIFSKLSGQCYVGEFVCVRSSMCVPELVCFECFAMRCGGLPGQV